MKEVYLIGSGGHARSLLNLLELNFYSVRGIFDDSYKESDEVNGYPLLGKLSDIRADYRLVIARGEYQKRLELYRRYQIQLIEENLIHPQALIEKRMMIGKNNQIFAKAYINTNVVLGNNNLLNSGCVLEHEVVVGDHNHISVSAILCGRSRIGDCCFIGAGAVIIDKVNICNSVVVGANSTVVEDIKEPGIYVGCPARKIK